MTNRKISIALNCYIIRFRERGNTAEYLQISEAFGGWDFTKIMQEFIKTIDHQKQRSYINADANRILFLKEIRRINQSVFTGIMHKGHNGQETYINEVAGTSINNVGVITKEQYSCIPFFFLLSQPSKDSRALILLAQTYKQFGFKEIFSESFKSFVSQFGDSNVVCDIGTLSVPTLFERYVREGSFQKLKFIKHKFPVNFENVLDSESDQSIDETFKAELALSAGKKGFGIFRKKILSMKDDSNFLEVFAIEGFSYDEAFGEIIVNGRKRIMNLSQPADFGASYDITDEVSVNSTTNHPDFEKVEKEALSILESDLIPLIK